MGLIQDLEESLFHKFIEPIFSRFKAALGPFGKLFDLIGQFWTKLTSTRERIQTLTTGIFSEINAWRNFREDIHVRTGVVNLPKAIEKTQQLIDQVRSAWLAIVDIGQRIRGQIEAGGNPAEEAEQAAKDIESSGIKAILEKFPKLARGLEKLLGFLAIVVSALESIEGGIDDLQQILDAITSLREEIESGSTIFLQQGNSRRKVHLDDGTVMKIRVGNLHS